jgi:ubiquinone biosynthesis protein COQ4
MEMQHDFQAMPIPVHPDRPTPKFRPLLALKHFRALIKDKENTEHVFHIFEALPRKSFRDDARAFGESEQGRAVFAQERYLPDLLDDHERLRAMPEGSVAHAYCDFMEREGLSAGGLVAEAMKFNSVRHDDMIEWYGARNRDTHDLLHVLTGYGRDPLGEQCVLAFTYGQDPSLGHLFIGYTGGLNVKHQTKTKAPILRAITEAKRLGKACPRICEVSITDLLAQPLEEVRERFNIAAPARYQEAHRILHEEGHDPHEVMEKAA